ncbi:MAG TPA: Panacea domain-containing protein [Vicinamibacterales bacterium]
MANRRLRFEFSLDKFVAVMTYFVDVGKVHDLTKLKAAKLLFFADKTHLLRYGRPILGDRYVSMDHGPVPSAALDLMNRLIAPDEIEDPVREQLRTKLSVHRLPFSRNHPFRAKVHGEAVYQHLSQTEREVLDEIIAAYGRKSVGELIDLTHKERAWQVSDGARPPGSCAPMPYELFFEGEQAAEAKTLREFADAQQEDRDFISSLSR